MGGMDGDPWATHRATWDHRSMQSQAREPWRQPWRRATKLPTYTGNTERCRHVNKASNRRAGGQQSTVHDRPRYMRRTPYSVQPSRIQIPKEPGMRAARGFARRGAQGAPMHVPQRPQPLAAEASRSTAQLARASLWWTRMNCELMTDQGSEPGLLDSQTPRLMLPHVDF